MKYLKAYFDLWKYSYNKYIHHTQVIKHEDTFTKLNNHTSFLGR